MIDKTVKDVLELFEYSHHVKICLIKLFDEGSEETVTKPKRYDELLLSDVKRYLNETYYSMKIYGSNCIGICFLDPDGEWK